MHLSGRKEGAGALEYNIKVASYRLRSFKHFLDLGNLFISRIITHRMLYFYKLREWSAEYEGSYFPTKSPKLLQDTTSSSSLLLFSDESTSHT